MALCFSKIFLKNVIKKEEEEEGGGGGGGGKMHLNPCSLFLHATHVSIPELHVYVHAHSPVFQRFGAFYYFFLEAL